MPISQSWYTFPDGSGGSPCEVNISACLCSEYTTVALVPSAAVLVFARESGADSTAVSAAILAWA